MYGEGIDFQLNNCKSGHDFELWTQGLLVALGFEAKLTGGNDNGVDIIATITVNNQDYKFYIQCKLYNRTVGKAPVQEVYAGHSYFGGDGYPVVITASRMTAEAKAYAKKLGVEVISEYQLNELQTAVKQKKEINTHLTGLYGIIMALIFRDTGGVANAVSTYEKAPVTDIEKPTDEEQLKSELISAFDQADLLLQEAAEKQAEVYRLQQHALSLQKAALLKNLEYGCREVSGHVLEGANMSDFYEQFINGLGVLSVEKLQHLISVASAKLPKEKTPTENKDLGNNTPNCCPKCGSTSYKKHGTKDGRQRYVCKDCKKTFSESNATIFYHSRLSTAQWKELLRGMIDRLSTTEIARNVGISQPVVWYNMQKVFEVLSKVYGKQDSFIDIAEADETFTHTSFKGK